MTPETPSPAMDAFVREGMQLGNLIAETFIDAVENGEASARSLFDARAAMEAHLRTACLAPDTVTLGVIAAALAEIAPEYFPDDLKHWMVSTFEKMEDQSAAEEEQASEEVYAWLRSAAGLPTPQE